MSVRPATVGDLPRILEIYGHYVKHTAISFEYEVPGLEAFTQRFMRITRQFPYTGLRSGTDIMNEGVCLLADPVF